jgi:hypothetical protein
VVSNELHYLKSAIEISPALALLPKNNHNLYQKRPFCYEVHTFISNSSLCHIILIITNFNDVKEPKGGQLWNMILVKKR